MEVSVAMGVIVTVAMAVIVAVAVKVTVFSQTGFFHY